MATYGVYGSHTTEACPLNHKENRMAVIESGPLFKQAAESAGVKVLVQYHSGLEHTFLWVFESPDAKRLEELMIKSGTVSFNSCRIVPLLDFDQLAARLREIDNA
ncbi:MAG: hypothetical protein NPMRth3_50002 [Nitrosopumilales archaeon]|nr:MAG: hypothetical protein NPMRth3_50002 [Nitrosopumilales archaeon]